VNYALEAYKGLLQHGMILDSQCQGYGFYGWGGPGAYFWHPGHFMMIILFILLILLVYLVARNTRHSKAAHTSVETPLDIIKRRYASGEITKEQYEILKNDLKG
jgi:putative membrane protein